MCRPTSTDTKCIRTKALSRGITNFLHCSDALLEIVHFLTIGDTNTKTAFQFAKQQMHAPNLWHVLKPRQCSNKKNVSLKEAKKHFHDASNIISEDKINNSF